MRSPSVAMPVASRLLAQRVRLKFFNLTQHAQGHRFLAGGLSLSGGGLPANPGTGSFSQLGNQWLALHRSRP